MKKFINDSNQLITWIYNGNKNKKGMRNIVLRGQKPFCALVGFRLQIKLFGYTYSGFDCYGFVKSDENNVAIISTYMGRKPVEFQFLINCDLTANQVVASSTDTDQSLNAHIAYPPHWFQLIGLY